LLSFRVVQDDRRSTEREGGAHLLVKGREVAVTQARRYSQDLKLRLNCADLAVHVSQQIFYSLSDVLLDLSALIIDHAEDGETRERDERKCGSDGQHREPCLNAEAAGPHE
jgi:hypothetical protein